MRAYKCVYIYVWECVRAGHIGISVYGSRQSCPFVSSENASTVRNDDEIVLLVHCESWIARIRANEVVANRPCSVPSSRSPSVPLFLSSSYHTSSHPVLHSRHLRSVSSSSSFPHVFPLVSYSISSHILVHYLRSSASATCCPLFSTSLGSKRPARPGNERSTTLFTYPRAKRERSPRAFMDLDVN